MGKQSERAFLISVKADIKNATKELKEFAENIKNTGKGAKDTKPKVDGLGKSFGRLKQAAIAYLSVKTVQYLVLQADAFNILDQRIKTATKTSGDYASVSREIFSISQRNGAQLETTVSLFQGLARSAPELNATNKEMLRLTNLVEQLGVISGVSQASSRAGLLQFSQGLAAGVFRAEEFNSLLENLPELATRIAKGMGITVGELRKAVLDGKVLSKEVFESLIKQAPEIAAEFEGIPVSVDRASTSLGNSFSKFLNQLDEAVGLTDAIAGGLQLAADALDAGPAKVTIKEMRTDLKDLQTQLDAMGNAPGKNDASTGPLKQYLQKRINALTQHINDTLIAEGGPVGIRIAIDRADQEIESITASVDKMTERLGNKTSAALEQLKANLEKLKNQRQSLQQSLVDAELGKEDPAQKEDNTKKIDEITKALEQQAETLGKTNEEVALYKLGLLGATDAQLKLASSAAESIKTQKQAAEVQKEATRIVEQTRTAEEQLAAELENLDDLLNKGAIDWDTYSRAVFNATAQFDDLEETGKSAMDELIAATRGWGDEFTNTLAEMVQTGKLDFSSLADSIISDLLRIQIYQNITKPLFAGLGVPGFTVGTNHTGGMAGTGASKVVNPAVFLNAPRFHNGGFPGLNRNEVPAILEKNEEVLTRDDPRHMLNGGGKGTGSVKVEIIKNGSPVQVERSDAQMDVNGMVVKVIMDDWNRGGPIRRTIKGGGS